jgi:hypothetical protein
MIDRSSWWWQRGRAVCAVGGGLLAAGLAAGPVQATAWGAVRARQPELNLRDFKSALGQGVVLGLLGGFRTIIADFAWITGYMNWEKRIRPETEAMVNLTTLLDPQSVYFWSEGARIIGKDIPAWRVEDAQKAGNLTAEGELAIRREQGNRAQSLLDRGLANNPHNPTLLLDKAMIYDINMQDLADSIEQYRQAAAAPGAPYFLARVYAEKLTTAGHEREAYDYLRQLYPTLPANVPAAAKATVWERLREMEDDLKLPAAERLPPSAAPPAGKTPTAAGAH